MFTRSTLAAAGACVLSATALVACGGATSDGGSATESTTVAPLSREKSSSESSKASGKASESSEAAKSSGSSAPQDREAREVSEVPTNAPNLSDNDRTYLDALKDGGINVDGVEDSLIGTASGVCQNQDTENIDVMTHAVAGQLIEQGRTDKGHEEVAKTLSDASKAAYCH